MESLFKLTELESRIPLNMNVLVEGPRAQGDGPCRGAAANGSTIAARCWCGAPSIRLAQIEHRLEVLGGYLVAYLNLDKVIKIIRNEDEPKPVLMKTFKLTDVQADAILNMRLRNLRKLEEMEIKAEDKELREERKDAQGAARLREGSSGRRSPTDQGGRARSSARRRRSASAAPIFAEAPEHDEAAIEEAMVEREPITVVVSEKGWIRALRGHVTRSVRHRVQGRRRPEIRVPGRDHVEDPGVRHQRPLLHARRREAAGRARPRRAGAAVRRHRAGGRPGRGVPLSGRAQVPGGEHAGPRLRRARGRMPRQHPQGQAGAQRQAAGRGARAARRSRASWSRRSARTARW